MIYFLFNKIFKNSTLLIVFQLIVSPLAFSKEDSTPKKTKWQHAEAILKGSATFLSSATQALIEGRSQSNPEQYASSVEPLRIQPIELSQVPAALNGCLVLPASGNKLGEGLMCSDQAAGDILSGYAAALIEVTDFNLKQYENYTTKGHERYTTQGIGCYEKKIENFNTRLLAREEEIKKYKERLKALLDNFNLQTKNELEEIKRTSALLDGGDSKNKNLRDFKFEDDFLNDQNGNNICGSILSAAQFSNQAKKKGEGGFRGIEQMLFNKMNESSQKSGQKSMSSAEVLTKTKQISNEIDQLAKKLSAHLKNRETTKANLSDISFNGRILSKKNPAITKALSNFNIDIDNKVKDLESSLNISSIVTGELTREVNKIKGAGKVNLADLNQRLLNFENKEKFACLQKIIDTKFQGEESFASNFKNPNVSKTLQSDADSILRNNIASYFKTSDSIDELLSKVKSIEKEKNNSNYIMMTGKSINIEGEKTITASTPLRPSQLLGVFVRNCHKEFDATASGDNGFTKADAIRSIKKFATLRDQIRKTAPPSLSSEIKRQLKQCPEDTSTGIASLSCSNALNTGDENFCLRTATKCASNMKTCHAKAISKVKALKHSQNTLVQSYNNKVATIFRGDLKASLNELNIFLKEQSESIDKELDLGSVYETPRVKFNFSKEEFQGKEEGIDPNLELEDPAKYLANAIADIDAKNGVLAKLKKQREDLVGSNGKKGKLNQLVKGYINNYTTQIKASRDIIKDCKIKFAKSETDQSKYLEQLNKDNQEISGACNEVIAFNNSPLVKCGKAGEIASNVLAAAALASAGTKGQARLTSSDQLALAQMSRFDLECRAKSAEGDNVFSGGGVSGAANILNICSQSDISDLIPNSTPYCSNFEKYVKDAEKVCDGGEDELLQKFTQKFCFVGGERKSAGNCKGDICKESNCKNGVEIDIETARRSIASLPAASLECTFTQESLDKKYKNFIKTMNNMVSAYNAHKQSSTLGERQNVSISFCNNDLSGDGNSFTSKGGLEDSLSEMGRAIGNHQATRNP